MSEESSTVTDRMSSDAIDEGHGEAALLLVESLIHGLVSNDVMSVSEAIEVVDIAVDAHAETSTDSGRWAPATLGPVALLEAIGASLRHDLPDDG